MIKYACITLLITTLSAHAQVVVDESMPFMEQAVVKKAITAVADEFPDPIATQFRHLKLQPDGSICGQVNTKNLQGAYVGFKPFKFIPERHKVYLENAAC